MLSLVDIDYEHKENWAPEAWLLDGFKNSEYTWEQYVVEFHKTIERRNILQGLDPRELDGCVLLCTEVTPQMCHRRLLAEYFKGKFPEIEIVHL